MSELPLGWIQTTIGEIARIETGSTPPKRNAEYYSREICFFKPGDLDIGGTVSLSEDMVSKTGAAAGRLLPPRTLLVTCIGNLGKSALTEAPSICNQQINAVLPTPVAEPEYLYYWSRTIRSWLEEHSSATTVSIINKGRFSEAPIQIAPLAEQRRIITKIEGICTKSRRARDQLDRVPRLVEKYKQAILAAAFRGNLTRGWRGNSNANWKEVKPKELFEWSSGKNLPAKRQANGNIPVIGGNGVSGCHDTALIDFPTLVVGRVGAQCGNVHRSDGPAWVTDNAIYAKSISQSVDLDFAVYFFRVANLNSLAGGTGQPYVNQTILNDLDMPLPSTEEQREIVRCIQRALTWIDRLASEAGNARKLIDYLDRAVLTKAFQGELVPQNPSDEPASVLLERIRAERKPTLSGSRAIRTAAIRKR